MTSVSSLGSAAQLPANPPAIPAQRSSDSDRDTDAQAASVAKDADKTKTASVHTLA